MTHILEDFSLGINDPNPEDLFKIANEVHPSRRKKMTDEQIVFVRNVLPIYLENDVLRDRLPIIMEIYDFPSPFSIVFVRDREWE